MTTCLWASNLGTEKSYLQRKYYARNIPKCNAERTESYGYIQYLFIIIQNKSIDYCEREAFQNHLFWTFQRLNLWPHLARQVLYLLFYTCDTFSFGYFEIGSHFMSRLDWMAFSMCFLCN
jgi:hypothetical protein